MPPPMPIDLADKRILVFIVAYNAEKTIESVLDRIPEELRVPNVEVLVIDDSSKDATFQAGLKREQRASNLKVTMLRNPRAPEKELGYVYLRPAKGTAAPANQVVVYEAWDKPPPVLAVGFADGHAEMMDYGRFEKALAESKARNEAK